VVFIYTLFSVDILCVIFFGLLFKLLINSFLMPFQFQGFIFQCSSCFFHFVVVPRLIFEKNKNILFSKGAVIIILSEVTI